MNFKAMDFQSHWPHLVNLFKNENFLIYFFILFAVLLPIFLLGNFILLKL